MKYAVHPGYVISKTDGDRHYISALQLAFLYRLYPDQFVVWDDKDPRSNIGRNPEVYKHLYPRIDGDYKLHE